MRPLYESYASQMLDWPYGTFIAIVIFVAAIAVLFVLYTGLRELARAIYVHFDSRDRPSMHCTVTIKGKRIREGYWDNLILGDGILDSKWVPRQYIVRIVVGANETECTVSEQHYAKLTAGKKAELTFISGRYSMRLYPQSLALST